MKRVLVLLGILVVGAIFFFTRPEQQSARSGKETLRFADTSFETLWLNNAIAGYVIENGYDYPVEMVQVTTPIANQSLESGEIDVYMELWRTNSLDWYTRVTKSGAVLDLGDTYERSTQGFYVPRYVIEGDAERGIEPSAPDLVTVFDLPRYKDAFPDREDPNKGLLVNCIIGWQCQEINVIKMHAYGLMDHYNVQEPGTAAALDSAIAGAYRRGEPVLAYYWEPTWLAGTFDLVQLEEPPYSDACNEEIQRALTGQIVVNEVSSNAGCHYEEIGIHKGVNADLEKWAPEIVAFLRRMTVGTDPLSEMASLLQTEGLDVDQAALWFFENYQDRWRSWVPEDVERKLVAALQRDGVNL